MTQNKTQDRFYTMGDNFSAVFMGILASWAALLVANLIAYMTGTVPGVNFAGVFVVGLAVGIVIALPTLVIGRLAKMGNGGYTLVGVVLALGFDFALRLLIGASSPLLSSQTLVALVAVAIIGGCIGVATRMGLVGHQG